MKSILFFTDDPELKNRLTKTLEDLHYHVRCESNVTDGLATFDQNMPDLVLLDNRHEDINDDFITNLIAHNSFQQRVPIIVLMNTATANEAARLKILGVTECLSTSGIAIAEIATSLTEYVRDGATTRTDASGQLTRTIILVVEDDIFLSEIFSGRLQKAGYHVLVANDGEEALRISKREIPDIMLLDLIMPGMSGYDVMREMKNDPVLRNIPVVVCSNLAQESEINRAMEMGALDFLVKSAFVPAQLIEKVTQILANITKKAP